MALHGDEIFMKDAVGLAVRGRGRTSPNPMVGAVVVKDDEIVGAGYHEYVGGPHAEVNALAGARGKTSDATLYVTLEPCNHQGRTPPCTHAIIRSGVSRVVIGVADPNPHVGGGGADYLRKRGMRVDMGILEDECRLLNQVFLKHVKTGLPYVTLKVAATLDGRIATRTGESRWISNERSRRFVQELRFAADGVLVGISTALADDPQLTVRIRKKPPRRQPIRIVLDSQLRLPLASHLVQTARDVPVWVACAENAPRERESLLEAAGVVVLRLPAEDGRVDLRSLLKECGGRQLTSLLVEGGGRVLGAFLDQQLADSCYFFYAPKVLGDAEAIPMVQGGPRLAMTDALQVHDLRVKRFGEDVMLSGRFHKEPY
jgi:diaminohydroxyphosphoribosylaminopyrimidine deaminase / 5-amino-6-(5-phosphoribosylamino)uracil reductase